MPSSSSSSSSDSKDGMSSEEFQAYLEKKQIKPKDLVMFSAKTQNKIASSKDFSYLNVSDSYDIDVDKVVKAKEKTLVWGIPYYPLRHPLSAGVLSGLIGGILYNTLFRSRQRPPLPSVS